MQRRPASLDLDIEPRTTLNSRSCRTLGSQARTTMPKASLTLAVGGPRRSPASSRDPWLQPPGLGSAGCGAGLAGRLPESLGVRQPESGWEGSPCGRGFRSVMESRGKRKCVPCPFDTLTLGEPGPWALSLQLQRPPGTWSAGSVTPASRGHSPGPGGRLPTGWQYKKGPWQSSRPPYKLFVSGVPRGPGRQLKFLTLLPPGLSPNEPFPSMVEILITY